MQVDGDINTAERIRSGNTELDAKRINYTISTNSAWEAEKVEVMMSYDEYSRGKTQPSRSFSR